MSHQAGTHVRMSFAVATRVLSLCQTALIKVLWQCRHPWHFFWEVLGLLWSCPRDVLPESSAAEPAKCLWVSR